MRCMRVLLLALSACGASASFCCHLTDECNNPCPAVTAGSPCVDPWHYEVTSQDQCSTTYCCSLKDCNSCWPSPQSLCTGVEETYVGTNKANADFFITGGAWEAQAMANGPWHSDGYHNGKPRYVHQNQNQPGALIIWEDDRGNHGGSDWAYWNLAPAGVPKWTLSWPSHHQYWIVDDTVVPPSTGWTYRWSTDPLHAIQLTHVDSCWAHTKWCCPKTDCSACWRTAPAYTCDLTNNWYLLDKDTCGTPPSPSPNPSPTPSPTPGPAVCKATAPKVGQHIICTSDTAMDSWGESSHDCTYAIMDGNELTKWSKYYSRHFSSYVEIDWPQPVYLKEAKIYSQTSNACEFQVQYIPFGAAADAWKTACTILAPTSVPTTGVESCATFDRELTQKIRLYKDPGVSCKLPANSDKKFRLTGIEVFECVDENAPTPSPPPAVNPVCYGDYTTWASPTWGVCSSYLPLYRDVTANGNHLYCHLDSNTQHHAFQVCPQCATCVPEAPPPRLCANSAYQVKLSQHITCSSGDWHPSWAQNADCTYEIMKQDDLMAWGKYRGRHFKEYTEFQWQLAAPVLLVKVYTIKGNACDFNVEYMDGSWKTACSFKWWDGLHSNGVLDCYFPSSAPNTLKIRIKKDAGQSCHKNIGDKWFRMTGLEIFTCAAQTTTTTTHPMSSPCLGDSSAWQHPTYGNCQTYLPSFRDSNANGNHLYCNLDKDNTGLTAAQVCPECAVCKVPAPAPTPSTCPANEKWELKQHVRCGASDFHPSWSINGDCTYEIMDPSNLASWGRTRGVHFKEWAEFRWPSKVRVAEMKIYTWPDNACDFEVQFVNCKDQWETVCSFKWWDGLHSNGLHSCYHGFPDDHCVKEVRIIKQLGESCYSRNPGDKWFRLTGVELFECQDRTTTTITSTTTTTTTRYSLCVGDVDTWDAGEGSCGTYLPIWRDRQANGNHLYCDLDKDAQTWYTARDVCPQCAKCLPKWPEVPPGSCNIGDCVKVVQPVSCKSNDWHHSWAATNDCTYEIMDQTDLTHWAKGRARHFTEWVELTWSSGVELREVVMYTYKHNACDFTLQYWSEIVNDWEIACSYKWWDGHALQTPSGVMLNCTNFPSGTPVKKLRIHKDPDSGCSKNNPNDRWFRLTGVELLKCPDGAQTTTTTTTTLTPLPGTCYANYKTWPGITINGVNMGDCSTYLPNYRDPHANGNHMFCTRHSDDNYLASQICPQCAQCVPQEDLEPEPTCSALGLPALTFGHIQQHIRCMTGINDWHPSWSSDADCTYELLDRSDLTRWGKNYGRHFKEWADFYWPTSTSVHYVKIYTWSGNSCDYQVQYKDASGSWITACNVKWWTGKNSGGVQGCNFPAGTVTTGIRIIKSKDESCYWKNPNDKWFRMTGLEVFACQATPPSTTTPVPASNCLESLVPNECATYLPLYKDQDANGDHLYCNVDVIGSGGYTASQLCPQCGHCLPPTPTPPTCGPKTKAKMNQHVTCNSNNWHPSWANSADCTYEIMSQGTLSKWGRYNSRHFNEWAEFTWPTSTVIHSVTVHTYSDNACSYDVQYKDSLDQWITACSVKWWDGLHNQYQQPCTNFCSVAIDKIRIVKSADESCRTSNYNDKWFRMTGLEIFTCETTVTTTTTPVLGVDCVGDHTTWTHPDYGKCSSYIPLNVNGDANGNHLYCNLDSDSNHVASVVCPQCGYCKPLLPSGNLCDQWSPITCNGASCTPVTCTSNDWHPSWSSNEDCTTEIMNENDLTAWAKGRGRHFREWAEFTWDKKVQLFQVEVYTPANNQCDFDVQYFSCEDQWVSACSFNWWDGKHSGGQLNCANFPADDWIDKIRIVKKPGDSCHHSNYHDKWFRLTGVQIFQCDGTLTQQTRRLNDLLVV